MSQVDAGTTRAGPTQAGTTGAETTLEQARKYIREGLLDPDRDMQDLSVAVYRRLAAGQPATRAALADDLGFDLARVTALLEDYPPSGIDFNAAGDVVAGGGLSLAETSHGFEIDGLTLHTWCVLDALFLPQIIGKGAILRTACTATGDGIRVHLEPHGIVSYSPNGVVMSIVGPDRQACRDNLRGAFCQHVLLFRDGEAFQTWSRDRGDVADDVAMVSLEEGHAMGVERNASRYPDIAF